MIKLWLDDAWEDYLYWQSQDKKTLKRINKLLQDIERNGYNGVGKPEALKGELSGFWSVKIDEKTGLFFVSKMAGWKFGNADRTTATNSAHRDV